jgi:hypothetical protein
MAEEQKRYISKNNNKKIVFFLLNTINILNTMAKIDRKIHIKERI